MEENEDATAAMAQAMGFSSFGAQTNSNKRRKFNPRADAVVASTSIPLHHVTEAKSGSNAIPLGVRSKNEDEITLEDDEVASITDSKIHFPLNEPSDDEPGPQYLDTSRPPDIAAVDPTGDTMSNTINDATTGDHPRHIVEANSSAANTSGDFVGHDSGCGGYQAQQNQEHEPEKKWWDDYYDPSSNVNPWGRLEHIKGLGPRGSWMSWEEAKR
ncbi:hypothetical protein F4814DRAFT_173604 [Daldinia grandis]|nr:hypothetical protein F4814DRAFT_173604 [Daldinia grandis]